MTSVVPEHLEEIRAARLGLITKTEAAVKERLTKEIAYWDHRAAQLQLQEQAGRSGARLVSGEARRRADELQARLQQRLRELQLEAQIAPLPPVVLGGVLVVPAGLIAAVAGRSKPPAPITADTQEAAARTRAIVMHTERALASSPPTASSSTSATTSRAASPAPASCASSRSRAACMAPHPSP